MQSYKDRVCRGYDTCSEGMSIGGIVLDMRDVQMVFKYWVTIKPLDAFQRLTKHVVETMVPA